MREKFEKDIAEESKTLKGKQLSEMSDIERFETLKMSQKSFTTDVSYEQISHIKIDDFVGIIQDVCVEENITAQVHPFEDRLIIETLTHADSEKVMGITWEVADQEFPPPQEVAEEFHPPYEVVAELDSGEVVGFVNTKTSLLTEVPSIGTAMSKMAEDFILHIKISNDQEIKLIYIETSPEQDARVIVYDTNGIAINQITVDNFRGNTQKIMRLLEELAQEITVKFRLALEEQQKSKIALKATKDVNDGGVIKNLTSKMRYPGPLLRQKADFSPEKRIKDYAMNMLKSSKAKEIKYLKKGM
jgi:hypothetical protein